MSQGGERRTEDRLDVSWRATLTVGDTPVSCAILDVATAGTKVALADPAAIQPGQEVLLTVDGLGDFAGRVAWRRGDELGLQILAGPDLLLKRFAESSGAYPSTSPSDPDNRDGQ